MGNMAKCPSCSRSFDTVHGMRIHHVQTHGESIAGEEITCEQCSEKFIVQRDKKDKRRFCSKECQNEWRSETMVGENHHNYNRITVECDCCGDDVTRPPSVINETERTFCSKECQYKSLGELYSERRTKEDNPNWQGKNSTESVQVVCDTCEKDFTVTKYQSQRTERNFCCRDCYNTALEDDFSGEDNPRWRGGYEPYYGPTWLPQRRKAIKRDDEQCVDCGMTRGEHYDEYDKDLEVHHQTPLREFEDTEEANKLSNLVTVCTNCHHNREHS